MRRRDLLKTIGALPFVGTLIDSLAPRPALGDGAVKVKEPELFDPFHDQGAGIVNGKSPEYSGDMLVKAINDFDESNDFVDDILEQLEGYYKCHEIPRLITVNNIGHDILLSNATFYDKSIKEPRVLSVGFTDVFLDTEMPNERPLVKIV